MCSAFAPPQEVAVLFSLISLHSSEFPLRNGSSEVDRIIGFLPPSSTKLSAYEVGAMLR